MLNKILLELYERDLNKLKTEIEGFTEEADLWKTGEGIKNSAGNLCLHLTGNLQHFIGSILGDSGYVRDRGAEFARKHVSRRELLLEVEETSAVLRKTLSKLNDKDFAKDYPVDVFGHPMTTGYFLVHLTTHFNYHLGQINYHRRLLAQG